MEDNKIVQLFFTRDEAAITSCAEKYGMRLRKLADSILRNSETAKECENDTYLKAWNTIPPHDPSNYLYSYLARITRHIALDNYRKNHAKRRDGIVVSLSLELEECLLGISRFSAEKELEDKELIRDISMFIRQLPQEERHIFIGRYWYAKSISELAVMFNSSESKVKSMLYRTRNKLNEHLKTRGLHNE